MSKIQPQYPISFNTRQSLPKQNIIPKQNLNSNNKSNLSFGALCRTGYHGWPLDTDFFRGMQTYKKVVNFLSAKHSQKLTVLMSAGSIGEDALTLRMLLKQKGEISKNVRIVSLDPDASAVSLGRQGVYSLLPYFPEGFLINNELELTKEEQQLKKLFFKHFVETTEPKVLLHNVSSYEKARRDPEIDLGERFFKLKRNTEDYIELRDAKEGNILNIDQFEPGEPVCAIGFKNASYQLTNNNIKRLKMEGRLSDRVLRLGVLDEVAEKLHSRLEKKGILFLGNFMGEHIYVAPSSMPDNKTIKLTDTSFYDRRIMSAYKDLRFMKHSPLEVALKKRGFKPVFWDSIEEIPEKKVPTIWQKTS